MKNQNDLDPDYYGPKPDAEKAAAIGCLLVIACFVCATGFALARTLYAWLMSR